MSGLIPIPGEDLHEFSKRLSRANMDKKILEKKPNTFSILYRSGSLYKQYDNNNDTIVHNGERIYRRPEPLLTGNFAEDITDYFRNRLIEGWGNTEDDILVRTSPLSWTIFFEVGYGVVQSDTLIHKDIDSYPPPKYHVEIMENIPMCLFDKFNIIDFPEWGEVVLFNYDKLKAEILDNYIISGSRETMEKSYKEALDIMEKFPNKYDLLKKDRTIEVSGLSGGNARSPRGLETRL